MQEILDNFEFRNQISRLSQADAFGTLIEKFLDYQVNLSPFPALNSDGSIRQPGLDNHAMGTIFEELVRRSNEENNEEAGEHWTPRAAVKLMAKLILLPIADRIESGTYLLYDGACGTGGMLTGAEETLQQLAAEHGKQVATRIASISRIVSGRFCPALNVSLRSSNNLAGGACPPRRWVIKATWSF